MDYDQPFHEAIARVTGDDMSTIRSRGFQPLNLKAGDRGPFDPEPDERAPLMIDWDRHIASSARRLLPLKAA